MLLAPKFVFDSKFATVLEGWRQHPRGRSHPIFSYAAADRACIAFVEKTATIAVSTLLDVYQNLLRHQRNRGTASWVTIFSVMYPFVIHLTTVSHQMYSTFSCSVPVSVSSALTVIDARSEHGSSNTV